METELKKQLKGLYSEKEISYFLRCISEDIPNSDSLSEKRWFEIIKRLQEQEPIQYITGVAPFYGYFFMVDSNVLIPRPETEELVYLISQEIKKYKILSPSILDIGSGSGCIPITLDLLIADAEILSVDVSESAISVARSNNEKLDTKVHFKEIDFLDESNWTDLENQYDIIVSNPPYIPDLEKELMSPNVLDHEPHLALFVENDAPLIFYKKIFEFALLNLKNKGYVFLECNEYNAQEVKSIYQTQFETEVIKDLQGKDRMIKARLL